ncbi:hypothetical protein M9H77_15968 [Catharanthus roseus]|uniref:Uncharacterized protein n=1 Tax=Catharanthus roseus TaxID=4058 RepID=A0ACC0AZ24_CATRO|nr:hypothetical protein M9H77_15968 [Catharanthus roseus]
MDVTHPIRVVLFWDSEHARDAYGPYFVRSTKKSWTFNQIITHDELVRKILKHLGMNRNLWRVRMTIRVPSFYTKYQMYNFTQYSMNNDDEMCYLWTITPNIENEEIHIVSDEPSMLYRSVNEDDDDDNDHSNEDYAISSKSDDDHDSDNEEDNITTPVNPNISTIVN